MNKKILGNVISTLLISITIFFLKMNNVSATEITCVYIKPVNFVVDQRLNTKGAVSDNFTVVYKYNDSGKDEYEIKRYEFDIDATNDVAKFSDGGFNRYVKKNEKCPSWVSYSEKGPNKTLNEIKEDTFYSKDVLKTSTYSYKNNSDVYISEGKFITKKQGDVEDTDTLIGQTPYQIDGSNKQYLVLQTEKINGVVSDKGKKRIKDFVEYHFLNENDDSKNVISKLDSIANSLGIDYLNVSNYSFSDDSKSFSNYSNFLSYVLGNSFDESKEPIEKNHTADDRKLRQSFFYYLEAARQMKKTLIEGERLLECPGDECFRNNDAPNIESLLSENENYKKLEYYLSVTSINNYVQKVEDQEKVSETKDAVESDYCLNLCTDDSQHLLENSELNNCKKTENYKKCRECYYDKCKGIGSSADKDNCNKSCMGEELYNNIVDSQKKLNARDEELNKILRIPEVPKINVDFKPYKVQCEDVDFLHTIYMVLVIMAPILVILFGSLDFAQSVMASDEKKILEFRKKLPKRLLLLVLFILIPTVITLILSLFGNGDTTLMDCVINGK